MKLLLLFLGLTSLIACAHHPHHNSVPQKLRGVASSFPGPFDGLNLYNAQFETKGGWVKMGTISGSSVSAPKEMGYPVIVHLITAGGGGCEVLMQPGEYAVFYTQFQNQNPSKKTKKALLCATDAFSVSEKSMISYKNIGDHTYPSVGLTSDYEDEIKIAEQDNTYK